MAKQLSSTCCLCGQPIRYAATNKTAKNQKLTVGAKTHDHDAKSNMHYGHATGKARSREQFHNLSDAAWNTMGVKKKRGTVTCCYECHEVICHNPVLSESQIERLATIFVGKSFEDRVVLFNRVIEQGLQAMVPTAAAKEVPPSCSL